MFEMAMKLEAGLWPSEADQFKLILELFLEEGNDYLNKDKFSFIFEKLFNLEESDRKSKPECTRLISSGALLATFLLNNFVEQKNYFAEIEGWVIYLSYCYALCRKQGYSTRLIESELKISNQIIYNALHNLMEEVSSRKHMVEGNAMFDQPVLPIRVTLLLSLVSIFWLWRRKENIGKNNLENALESFCKKYAHKMQLWGEASVPQFLAYFWYLKRTGSILEADFKIIFSLINTIVKMNKPTGKDGLANPYYQINDILPYIFKTVDDDLEDSFNGTSYFLESLIHLVTRRLWKQNVKMLWPPYSKIAVSKFIPQHKYSFYRWHCKKGTLITSFPNPTKQWKDLENEAAENKGKNIPDELKNNPVFLLLFCIVYPHRMNSEITRWLDSNLLKY